MQRHAMDSNYRANGLLINTVAPAEAVGHGRRDCGVCGRGCAECAGGVLGVAAGAGVTL